MQKLREFLIEISQKWDLSENEKMKTDLYAALYRFATCEGKYMNTLFENNKPITSSDNGADIDTNDQKSYSHPSNQVCGRVLQLGEKVYRCADCGYDDTCVICSFCFRKEDHEGHKISVYVSEANGGMCDCGDETAFHRRLNCACSSENEELPREFSDCVRSTIETLLDYILDVANSSINALPFIHKNINGRGILNITSKDVSDFGSLPQKVYGIEDPNTDKRWLLVLWNDEHHDYTEAEAAIIAATGCNQMKAKEIANEINSVGRAVLREAQNYQDLLEHQSAAEIDGLVATICSFRDYVRETIILHALEWIKDITTFDGNSPFRGCAKTSLAQVLLEPGFKLSNPIPHNFFDQKSQELVQPCLIHGIPLDGAFFKTEPQSNDIIAAIKDLSSQTSKISDQIVVSRQDESRIIYFLAFEVRFTSAVRKLLTRSLMPVLFLDMKVKSTFCEQYLKAYSMLTQILAASDREEELASSSDISVQLFTCPQTNKWIVTSNYLLNLLYPVCKLIEAQCAFPNSDGIPNIKDVVCDIDSKRKLASVQHTVKICVENITRVVTKNDEEDLLNYFLEQQTLLLFLTYLRFFQGLSPVTRKLGEHVERESITELYSFISKAVPVSSVVSSSTRVVSLNHVAAKRAIETIFGYLKSRGSIIDTNYDSRFKVSKDEISPFNPINYFLSFLIQATGISAVEDFLCDKANRFFSISDYSLRSIVLISQINVGLWIRNGISVSKQVKYLMESSADITYSRDIHLNQVAAIVDDPVDCFTTFLNRWELFDWFTGQVMHSETVYEQKFSFLCELFILFLYKLLVDRSQFDNKDARAPNNEKIKWAICYALCEEPKSYSELKKSLPAYISMSDSLDRLLNTCADYQPPSGLYDIGLYRLKAPLFKELDPMGQIDQSSLTSSFEVLYARIKDFGSGESILCPKIFISKSELVNTKIGSVFRTKIFAKFVYKLLQVAIDTEDEGYLPHLLHLLHAIILDGEMVFGENKIDSSLVNIPISNLLLTISESNMNPHIVSKATHLLDIFISRDVNVVDSLKHCFGDTHVESYMSRKNCSSNRKRQKQSESAEKRKAKILKKFAKQQKKFIEKNDVTSGQTDSLSSFKTSPLRTCVYCGESESTQKPFAIPSTTIQAPISWKLSPNHTELVYHAFSDYSSPYPQKDDEIYSKGYPRDLKHQISVMSSCAHGVHAHCHERARPVGSLPFPCPLCHNLYNEVMPSYIHDKQFVQLSLLKGAFSPKRLIVNPENAQARHKQLLKSVIHPDYFEEGGALRDNIYDHAKKASRLFLSNRVHLENPLLVLHIPEHLIATTIQAHEMAMRLDLSTTKPGCMPKISSALRVMVRSLIQTRVLLFEIHASKSSISDYLESLPKADSVFEEIVSLFFTTTSSLQSIMRYGFAKMIGITSITLCSDFDKFLSSSHFMSETLPVKYSKYASAFCQEYINNPKIDLASKSQIYFQNFYLALERYLLPFLRQCAMLKKLLFSHEDSDDDIEIDQAITTEKTSQGESDERPSSVYSIDPYCQYLNLPTLFEIMSSSKEEEKLMREMSIIKGWSAQRFAKPKSSQSRLLDYPNVPRLINLPADFSRIVLDPESSESICLLCGERISFWRGHKHQKECSSMTLLLSPEENSLFSIVEVGSNYFEIRIPGPYLTSHGEIKSSSSNEKAALCRLRYVHLNKLWINQELAGLMTRTMYGERMNPLGEAAIDDEDEMPEEGIFQFTTWI